MDRSVREWSAEIDVDEGQVRRLIGGQFPELALGELRLFAEGWDNAVWLVDERDVFRFPRRAIAIPGIQREMEVLPRLAPLLPLPIPNPVYHGLPADGYPWPFFGSRLLAGSEPCDVGLSDSARAHLGRPLGAFLRVLHSPAVAEAVTGAHTLPVDPLGRADMEVRVPRTREKLAEVERLGLWHVPVSVERLLDAALVLPPPGSIALVHGDLHFRHLLVNVAGNPTGVIDWGDMCLAPRSVDLSLLWSLLPPEGRGSFLEAYGPITEGESLRARVLAIFLCAALAAYGHHEGMEDVEREAVEGLTRAAVG
jgi:aminoglycoside phosphotransferase (APT) family kinase protein